MLRILAKLPIKIWIVVGVHAPFESSSFGGSIKEPRRNAQCSNLITGHPRGTDLIGLAIHVAGP